MMRLARVATWNIHGSIGSDGRCLPDRVADAIKAMDADVVALQEVDGRVRLGRRAHAFETFANLLGGNVVEARLFGRPGHEHGNLLWSRWPILASAVHLLPGGLEQRGLIEAEIALPHGRLRVFATHFGLSPITRRGQSLATLSYVCAQGGPAVVMGDFNEWGAGGPVHRRLSKALPRSLRPRTFPARYPIAPLDRIYGTEDIVLRKVNPPAKDIQPSDHLPVVADVSLVR